MRATAPTLMRPGYVTPTLGRRSARVTARRPPRSLPVSKRLERDLRLLRRCGSTAVEAEPSESLPSSGRSICDSRTPSIPRIPRRCIRGRPPSRKYSDLRKVTYSTGRATTCGSPSTSNRARGRAPSGVGRRCRCRSRPSLNPLSWCIQFSTAARNQRSYPRRQEPPREYDELVRIGNAAKPGTSAERQATTTSTQWSTAGPAVDDAVGAARDGIKRMPRRVSIRSPNVSNDLRLASEDPPNLARIGLSFQSGCASALRPAQHAWPTRYGWLGLSQLLPGVIAR